MSDLPNITLDFDQNDNSSAPASGNEEFAKAILQSIIKDQPLHDFLGDGLIALSQAVPSEAASFLEYHHSKKVYEFRAATGTVSDEIRSLKIGEAMGIVGEVGQTGLPKKVDEPAQESNHLKLVTEPHKFVTRNLIAIPIFIRGKLFGVVELLNCAGKASYSDSDFQKAIYLVQEFWVHAIEARLMLAFQPQKSQAS